MLLLLRQRLPHCKPNHYKVKLQKTSTNQQLKSFSSIPILNSAPFEVNHPECNISPTIASKIGTNLHLRQNHPLNIIKQKIESFFLKSFSEQNLTLYDNLSPFVTTEQNFDLLNFPRDHISRSKSDTYYYRNDTVLRTHTSAHQIELLKTCPTPLFLCTGDVYRRDEIDASHYPIFHQMEGLYITNDREGLEMNLKKTLEEMIQYVFNQELEMKWIDAYFPFTTPSFELEIYFNDAWLEVLGCGVVHSKILQNANRSNEQGWAFGLGLERLAMILFDIPDIRLFWTTDERFHSQFKNYLTCENIQFQPFSKFPPCFKDVSFWILNQDTFHVNDVYEVIRNIGGDLVEHVTCIDTFIHPKSNRVSKCFRISYRSMDRNLTNDEIDVLQFLVRKDLVRLLDVELR